MNGRRYGRDMFDDDMNPDMGDELYDPEQAFFDDKNFGPNDRFHPRRQNNRQGGFSRGNWRGFNQDRGRGPPMISRNYSTSHQGQGFGWGRGFGPAGPPIQKGIGNNLPIKYLLRCGVPKDKLRNLPRDFLNLIFPEHCGLCNIPLQSYEISRAHYVSQFHYKNQKRWVFQQNQQQQQHRQKKEPPFKPRDVYCELCDVQITSQVHAESHYAGKPHRAIVAKRKLPKNPRLHKKGMESRVEQLIRREQKNLAPVEEEPKPEPQKSSELHCDICKTFVTCADQMRMHLNGKKHLSKEKQHILKMMKGTGNATGTGDTANDAPKTGEEAEKEGEDPESQEEQAEEEGKFDWGNGSEAWDEPK